jgi:hypothetical protein
VAIRCFAVAPKTDVANLHGEPIIAIKRCIDHRHFYSESAAKLSFRLYSTCRRDCRRSFAESWRQNGGLSEVRRRQSCSGRDAIDCSGEDGTIVAVAPSSFELHRAAGSAYCNQQAQAGCCQLFR